MTELVQAYILLADINSRQFIPLHMIPTALQIHMDMPRAKAVKFTRILWNWLNWGYVPASAIPGYPSEYKDQMRAKALRRREPGHWVIQYNPFAGGFITGLVSPENWAEFCRLTQSPV